MSGIKDVPVKIMKSEWDRMVNNARCVEETNAQLMKRQKKAENAINAANERAANLERTLNQEINGLNEEMRQMAREQNRRFSEQANEFNSKIQKQAADFNGKLENQKRELQSSINEVSQQAEKNRQVLQNQINVISSKIEAKEKNAKKLAEFWISQTQAYINDIKQYRHEMFTPGQLERLEGKLKQMLSDINNGMYEAAISTARGLFNDAVDLKEAVLNAETEWLYYHGLFQKVLADTEANLDYRKSMQFTFATEDGNETVDANINYWTENALDLIEEKFAQIKQKASKPNEISIDKLKEMTEALGHINDEMEITEAKAKEALISSQFRAEIASKLVEVLKKQCWECKEDDIAYEGGDYNEKVHVKLSDIKGNEIVAVITPDGNMANNVELNFFNIDNDEGFRQTQLESLQKSLKEGGDLEIGAPVCRKGYEEKNSDNHAIKNIQATAAKKKQKAGN